MTFPDTTFTTGTTITSNWLNAVNDIANNAQGIVNVKAFGAVGDGVTDDTAAIQAAIDYAATQIVVSASYPQITAAVYVPAGTYKIASGNTLQLKPGIRFSGESRSSVFFKHGGGSVPCFNTNSASTSNNNIQVENISITGAGATTTAGIKMNNNFRNGEISNVTISNCNINLDVTDCWTLLVSHCDFQDGIVNNIKAANVTQGTFISCRIDEAGEDNVYLTKSTSEFNVNPVFFNCAIQRAGKNGINAVDVDMFSVSNSYFEGNNVDNNSYADIAWVNGAANRGVVLEVYGCFASATGGGNTNKFIYANTSGKVSVVNTRNYNAASTYAYATGIDLGSNVKRCSIFGSQIEATTRINRASASTGLIDTENYETQLVSTSSDVIVGALNNLYYKLNSPANRRLEFILQADGVNKWYVGRGDSDELIPGDFYISNQSGGGLNAPFRIEDSTNAVFALLAGPFADDTAAAAGGVGVGFAYRKTGGTVAWRVS